ncbi:uncharacterized protein LOC110490755 isoform X2 [Oncorhynchus mykiss]|uniref:uncharacterized protein LOC110490755 isoform X2 n=1 Tax=Oncorhynchus mykiss TaxID=8022 RepID=UPI0018788625|nr:uncharacterized protein LOC110490755 isoform X2 [Oncorhynchus mykiss]XP_036800560.1 uncharacterized protein LOC110490755 isoform X2 [Oncorhynchus mykiss]
MRQDCNYQLNTTKLGRRREEKQPQSMMFPPPCFTVANFRRAWTCTGLSRETRLALRDLSPWRRNVLLMCKYTYFKPADRCVEEKHELQWLDATKCFFKGPCGQRAITLDRLPHKHCSNCVLFKWERDGMLKEKSGPKIAGEVTSSPSSSTACCSP